MDSLHSIVKSLNRTEKRYFKLFASQFKSDSQLLRLFDALYDSEEYDEPKLKKLVGNNNLLPAKGALRKLLFKAMRNYREDASVQQKIRNDISDIDFLLRKGLSEEANKEIKKAIKAADKNAAYNYLAELLIYEGRASNGMQKEDSVISFFDELEKQYEDAVKNQLSLQRALLINYHITNFFQSNSYQSPEFAAKHMQELAQRASELLSKAEAPFPRIMLLANIAFGQSDKYKSIAIYEEIRQLYRNNEELIPVNPMLYMALLSNYTLLVVPTTEDNKIAKQLFAETEKAFIDYDSFFKYYPDRVVYLTSRLISNKLYYARANSDWTLLSQLEEDVREYKRRKVSEAAMNAIHASMLVTCFYHQGNYDKTLEWVNNFYALSKVKSLKTFMICVRLFEVFAFYKNKQYDFSDSRAINLYKTFLEQKFTADYYKTLGIVLCKLNHWDVKKPADKKEIQTLIMQFEQFKKDNDPYYVLYMSYLQPEEILQDVLAGKN